MRLFGLIGYPLVQSFSRKFFLEKFAREGLTDCGFENFSIPAITDVEEVLHRNPALEGLAVTIPYKQQVIPYLHDSSGIPEGLNACNCIRIRDGKLYGFNTDYIGFEKSFVPLLQPHHKKALVLGNGGATEAVLFVLRSHGIAYNIVSRQLHGQSSLTYDKLNDDLMKEHTVVINTTPLGMYPDTDSFPAIPYHAATPAHYFYDLVYNPVKTLFLQKAEEQGAVICNGADMLVLQAEENWRIWNS
jgi:shikimate dehydrogenase